MLTNFIQSEIKEIEKSTKKKMLNTSEVANYIGVSTDDLLGLIDSGEIEASKTSGNILIKVAELVKFLYGVESNDENKSEKPIDSGLTQRYPSPPLIEDLSEEDYEGMERRGKGEGSVYFNEGRQVWQVAISLGYDANSKRLRKIISAKEKDDVMKAMKEFMSIHNSGKTDLCIPKADALNPIKMAEHNEMTFRKFLNNFLTNMEGGPQSRTFVSYVGVAKHIEKGLGNVLLSELDKAVCQRFLNSFTEKTYTKGKITSLYSQSMIHKVYMLMKMALRDAAESDFIRKNFMDFIKEPKAKKFVEPEYKALTDDEIRSIMLAVEDNLMLKAIVMIMNYTGMRPGEVYALRRSDIDFEKNTINVNRALSFTQKVDVEAKAAIGTRKPIIKDLKNEHGGKVNNAKRTLTVSSAVIEVIKEWLKYIEAKPGLLEKRKENGIGDYLFSGVNGNLVTPDIHTQVYDRHLPQKGLSSSEFKLYRFRHTCCTRLLKMGKDPKMVMMIMGDNTLDMVLNVYASINKDDITKASSDYADMMDCTLAAKIG